MLDRITPRVRRPEQTLDRVSVDAVSHHEQAGLHGDSGANAPGLPAGAPSPWIGATISGSLDGIRLSFGVAAIVGRP